MSKKQYGYWTEENCIKEAKNYKTIKEFRTKSITAYSVACKNNWIKDYTWLERECVSNGYWTYKTCYEEAKKYESKKEFMKKSRGAYKVAIKNKWINDYTWLEKRFFWTYDTCYKEAKKYNTRKEFHDGNQSAYHASHKNGWINDFTWLQLQRFYWTYEKCEEEAKKYKTTSQFRRESLNAYEAAKKYNWLDKFTWLIHISRKIWNEETCREESKKYKTRNEFSKKSSGAYNVANKNNWLDSYTWLKKEQFDLYKDKIDCIYVYEFKDQNSVYVGRTLMRLQKQRDKEHIFRDTDTVFKFAKENDIAVPEMKILEDNLTIEEGSKKEGYWIERYRLDGWNIINIAKPGSIGKLGKGKWNYKRTKEEAKKYKTRNDFRKSCSGAYFAAIRNKWIDDYIWFVRPVIYNKKWTYETTKIEASNYNSRNEFKKGSSGAYAAARNNKWLDEFFPKTK